MDKFSGDLGRSVESFTQVFRRRYKKTDRGQEHGTQDRAGGAVAEGRGRPQSVPELSADDARARLAATQAARQQAPRAIV